MSFELALISRIMQGNGHLTEVLDFGVATEDFTGTEARAYWNSWCRDCRTSPRW